MGMCSCKSNDSKSNSKLDTYWYSLPIKKKESRDLIDMLYVKKGNNDQITLPKWKIIIDIFLVNDTNSDHSTFSKSFWINLISEAKRNANDEDYLMLSFLLLTISNEQLIIPHFKKMVSVVCKTNFIEDKYAQKDHFLNFIHYYLGLVNNITIASHYGYKDMSNADKYLKIANDKIDQMIIDNFTDENGVNIDAFFMKKYSVFKDDEMLRDHILYAKEREVKGMESLDVFNADYMNI